MAVAERVAAERAAVEREAHTQHLCVVPRLRTRTGLGRAPCVQCGDTWGELPCATGNARNTAGGRSVHAARLRQAV